MVEFGRKHDLMPLLDLCISREKDFQEIRDALQGLDRYAVIVRYPGVKIDLESAEAALSAATKVRKFVRAKLG
jgi:hypothetical protein